jgi:hypothetical protein
MEFEVRRAYGILGKDQVHKTLIRKPKGNMSCERYGGSIAA